MPKTSTELNRTKERKYWMERLQNLLTEAGEVCLEYKGNGLCVPAVDENDNEYYVALTVAIPTGGRDGEKFDGYAVAQDYKLHKEEVAFTTQQNRKNKKQKNAGHVVKHYRHENLWKKKNGKKFVKQC